MDHQSTSAPISSNQQILQNKKQLESIILNSENSSTIDRKKGNVTQEITRCVTSMLAASPNENIQDLFILALSKGSPIWKNLYDETHKINPNKKLDAIMAALKFLTDSESEISEKIMARDLIQHISEQESSYNTFHDDTAKTAIINAFGDDELNRRNILNMLALGGESQEYYFFNCLSNHNSDLVKPFLKNLKNANELLDYKNDSALAAAIKIHNHPVSTSVSTSYINNYNTISYLLSAYRKAEEALIKLKDGKGKALALIPLENNNCGLLSSFIQQGYYSNYFGDNVSKYDYSEFTPILNSLDNQASRIFKNSYLLHKLFLEGLPTLAALDELLAEGAILEKTILTPFLTRLLTKEDFIDSNEIEAVITSIIKNTPDIYAASDKISPHNGTNLLRLFLEKMPDPASLQHSKTIIALVKNRCSLDLSDELKSKLLKTVILQAPDDLIYLAKNGFLTNDLVIDGKSIQQHVIENVKDEENKKQILEKISRKNLIEDKKIRFLNEPIFYEEHELNVVDPITRETFLKEMFDGLATKKATAVLKEVPQKQKVFLEKTEFPIESKFGNDIFRILSNKQFAAKHEILILEKGKIKHGVKWDSSINKAYFLKEDVNEPISIIPAKKDDQKFLANYARMCGILQVLGEPDDNPTNYLVSRKTNRPVKIDNTFLVNNNPVFVAQYQANDRKGIERFKVYGSAQSHDFLCSNLAGGKSKKFDIKPIESFLRIDSHKYTNQNSKFKAFAQTFIDSFNKDIDDDLLEKIKANLQTPGNQALKEQFIEFMRGIEDAINLANDDDFLTDYTKKYQILGDRSFTIANKCKEFFKENAELASKQFKKFLDYYHDLEKELTPASASSAEAATSVEDSLQKKITAIIDKTADELGVDDGRKKAIRNKGKVLLSALKRYQLEVLKVSDSEESLSTWIQNSTFTRILIEEYQKFTGRDGAKLLDESSKEPLLKADSIREFKAISANLRKNTKGVFDIDFRGSNAKADVGMRSCRLALVYDGVPSADVAKSATTTIDRLAPAISHTSPNFA